MPLKPMKLVLLCHPSFLSSQSMPRFAAMLKTSYKARGHSVEVWSPRAKATKYVPPGRLFKWAGYIDQYVFFPIWIRGELERVSEDTLFVFCDQALGPWVPLVKQRHHVVHAHDLLALRSALGDLPENVTSFSGRIYQRYIRRGFRQARYFICVSKKTREDLHRYGGIAASASEVVYNGMNYPYAPLPPQEAAAILRAEGIEVPETGMLLHVGGGQWYKNMLGVVAIYSRYAAQAANPLPLWCVSPRPTASVREALAKLPERGRVVFLGHLNSAALQALYSLAKAFLFPSLAEGFGWPLIEAQACGCPVITTDEPPMNEVGGPAAHYLPRLRPSENLDAWARKGAEALQDLLGEGATDKVERAQTGRHWASRFDADKTIDDYLMIYRRILENAETPAESGFGFRQSSQ
jgi:glycosyltransferase involved in cell wall biosynthesis